MQFFGYLFVCCLYLDCYYYFNYFWPMKLASLLFFFFVHLSLFGQYEDMLHKPYVDRIEGISKLHAEARLQGDSINTVTFLADFKIWAEANKDSQLAMEADLVLGNYYQKFYRNDPRTIEYFIALAEKARTEKFLEIEERVVRTIILYYWKSQDYQNAFKWLLRSASNLNKMDEESFPPMAKHLNTIGKCHYFFRDYKSALIYFEKCSKLKRTTRNNRIVIDAQNTSGLCYQKLGEYGASDNYFLKIIEDTTQFQSATWKGIASGNLGYNYYLQGDYEKAIPLFKIDIESALKGKADYGLAAGSTIPLADIYLKRNELEKSKEYIDSARKYILKSRQTDRLRKLYPVMSKWFALAKQPDSSTVYLDSSILVSKRFDEKYNSLKLMRANQEFFSREKEFEVSKLKTESLLKISQRNYTIIIVILLLSGSIFAYWSRNKYLLKKQQMKDLAFQSTQKDLEHAKSELEKVVKKLNQNNAIIGQLKKGALDKADSDIVEQLKSTSILTQEDWIAYREMFKKTYPNFILKLNSSFPDLSPAEKRCLCLEKLKMSNNEMALALGVSANTVIVTKHRIRKKLGLTSQEELSALVNGLN